MSFEGTANLKPLLPKAPSRTAGGALDRRGFVLRSFQIGAASAVGLHALGCPGGGGPADGSFANPWTSADFGANDATLEVPAVYAAQADATAIRLWIEIRDPGLGGLAHPQQQDHYTKQIAVYDQSSNLIDSLSLSYQNQARLITTNVFDASITSVAVYTECSVHGWWRMDFDLAGAAGNPAGDFRRPLTETQPGNWADKVAVHLPVFGQRPNGDYSIEVGSRAADKLHEMTPEHYISAIRVYDQYSQERLAVSLDPTYNQEPVIDFEAIGGTEYLRIVAQCNLHEQWEAVYKVAAASGA